MNNSTAKAKPKMTVKNGVIYGDALSAQEKKRIVTLITSGEEATTNKHGDMTAITMVSISGPSSGIPKYAAIIRRMDITCLVKTHHRMHSNDHLH